MIRNAPQARVAAAILRGSCSPGATHSGARAYTRVGPSPRQTQPVKWEPEKGGAMNAILRTLAANADLLEPLTEHERDSLIEAVTSSAIEGFEPTRRDLAALADRARGVITFEEYLERTGISQYIKAPPTP